MVADTVKALPLPVSMRCVSEPAPGTDDDRSLAVQRTVRFQVNITGCLPALQAVLKSSVDDQIGILIGRQRRAKQGQPECDRNQ